MGASASAGLAEALAGRKRLLLRLTSSCPKIVILTILGSRFANKPRITLQKRGLWKKAVHPCTARQCQPQNVVP